MVMKFTLVPILLAFIILPNLSLAQYSISLDKSNTFSYGNSYLIDLQLKKEIKNLFVKDFGDLMPIKAFEDMHITQVDNTNYLDSIFIAKKALNKKKFSRSAVLNRVVILDSIDRILTAYKSITKPSIDKKFEMIYYAETIPTVGAGDDSILRAKAKNLKKFVKDFEITNNVKIGDFFIIDDGGHEGGVVYYFSLSGLTGEQKIKFIDERKNTLNPNRLKNNVASIYTPQRMAINYLKPPIITITDKMQEKIDADKVYADIEIMPTYPGGDELFKKLFKNIHFQAGWPGKLSLQFIVAKNGALNDVKVLRGGDSQTEKEVRKIIRHAKKWNPGIFDGKPVKVAITYYIPNSQTDTPQ